MREEEEEYCVWEIAKNDGGNKSVDVSGTFPSLPFFFFVVLFGMPPHALDFVSWEQ